MRSPYSLALPEMLYMFAGFPFYLPVKSPTVSYFILIIVSTTCKISPFVSFLCCLDANVNGCYGDQRSLETYQPEVAIYTYIYIYIYFTHILVKLFTKLSAITCPAPKSYWFCVIFFKMAEIHNQSCKQNFRRSFVLAGKKNTPKNGARHNEFQYWMFQIAFHGCLI